MLRDVPSEINSLCLKVPRKKDIINADVNRGMYTQQLCSCRGQRPPSFTCNIRINQRYLLLINKVCFETHALKSTITNPSIEWTRPVDCLTFHHREVNTGTFTVPLGSHTVRHTARLLQQKASQLGSPMFELSTYRLERNMNPDTSMVSQSGGALDLLTRSEISR